MQLCFLEFEINYILKNTSIMFEMAAVTKVGLNIY